jgi:endonuclease/exonuclease/phosphatase family metal-dependent hydrolase
VSFADECGVRRFKRIALILLSLVILMSAYRVLGVYELRPGECSANPPRHFANSYPKHLVVMTYNIEGHASLLKSHHIEEIAATINRHHPDIVGLNEVHRGTWQARFGDHTSELARLTGMKVLFGRSYRFLGGDFGNAVLTRGDFVSSEVHDLPGIGEPRTLLETIVRINGGTIDFYVGHTAAWASLNEKARGLQLKCMNAHVNASAFPYILVGDLNAPPESDEIARFLDVNTLKFVGNPKEPTHKLMGDRLDYILTDPGWLVRSTAVLDEGPSDHRPVIAELVHP